MSVREWSKQALKLHPSGQKMPLVGLGTWKIQQGSCAKAVYDAIAAGYRLLDCACDYGNEQQVGEGIKMAIDEGLIKRKDLFVTSKLWNTFHAREHVRPACEKTLADLGLDYLDLYLIHFPISLEYVDPETRYPPEWFVDPSVKKQCTLANIPIRETWEAMEELVPSGLAKSIGVANFTSVMLMDLLKYAKVHPSVNQVEIHPYLQQTQLLEYCAHHKIAVTAYSSFGGQSYVELNADSALKTPSLLKHEKISAIAKKHKVSSAQVLLRWAIQKNLAIIPKTSDPKRLIENADLFSFELSDEEMKTIISLNIPLRFNDPKVWFGTPLTIFG